MSAQQAAFEVAQQVADAVLYEGYALYPYRASAAKNQVRWQFGVLMPRGFAERDGSEAWRMQTECLVEVPGPIDRARLDVRIRFLQVRRRSVEAVERGGSFRPVDELSVDGRRYISWDEGEEQTIDLPDLALDRLAREELTDAFELASAESVERIEDAAGRLHGRVVRRTESVEGVIRLRASAIGGGARLTLAVENASPAFLGGASGESRREALAHALVGVHALLAVDGGSFVSMTDPPSWLGPAVAACRNVGTWPVLVGPPGSRSVVLSSPIILSDHPQIAPESQRDMYDSTEIDEILALRVLTLTDEEKAEARATDDRARAIVDRTEEMPPEVFDRLHGAIRSMDRPHARVVSSSPAAEPVAVPDAPYWEPAARVAPEEAEAHVAGGLVRRGSRVILRPGRRADAIDAFLAGRVGIVEAVFESVEDETYVAVSVEDDPAADLNAWYGRFLYFRPDELTIAEQSLAPADGPG